MIDWIKIIWHRLTVKRRNGVFYVTDLQGRSRPLCDVEMDGINGWDAPKFCDAFIANAAWDDTGKELTDAEIDLLNDDGQLVHELTYAQLY